MATKKYLKLGESAKDGSFYDPISKLSLVPGQVAERPTGHTANTSRLLKDALAKGHLVEATQEEYDEYLESREEKMEEDKATSKTKKSKKPVAVDTTEEDEEDEDEEEEETEEDEDDDEEMTKTELLEAIKNSSTIPADKKKGLSQMTKDDLQDLYDEYIKK